MSLYQNQYRVETTRLQTWNYANNGWYFVTICTKKRSHFFGPIVQEEMRLSAMGKITASEWQATAKIRPYVALDAWQIMPNHVHGIVVIDWSQVRAVNDEEQQQENIDIEPCRGTSLQFVPPRTTHLPDSETANQFGPLRNKSLQSIVNGFKGAVTRKCQNDGYTNFGWQERFWDHIIRSEEELYRTRTYIVDNPRKWTLDMENPPGLWM